jgi:hypothetical protein
MKKGENSVRISKLTNLFLGIALGTIIGYWGGTTNLWLAGIAIVIAIVLAIIYKNQR